MRHDRCSIGIPINVDAAREGMHFCAQAETWTYGALSECEHCSEAGALAGAPMLDTSNAREVLDPSLERREVFIGRRRIDHLWPIVAIALMFIIAMRAPDFPEMPASATQHACIPAQSH